jgi:hypothetical protein
MQLWIDAIEIDRGVLESGAGADRAAKHGRTRNNFGKLPAHSHDFVRVVDSFKIIARRTLRRDEQCSVVGTKAPPKDERSVGSNCRVDEILGEALRLRLGANEDRDAKHDADETEQQCAFAMGRKTQTDVKGGRHRVTVLLERRLVVAALVVPVGGDLDLPLQRDRLPQFHSRLL